MKGPHFLGMTRINSAQTFHQPLEKLYHLPNLARFYESLKYNLAITASLIA